MIMSYTASDKSVVPASNGTLLTKYVRILLISIKTIDRGNHDNRVVLPFKTVDILYDPRQ